MRNAKKWQFVPPFVPPSGLVPPFWIASILICHGQTSAHPLASHSKGAAHPAPARPTCRTVRPRGDNWHGSRPQGCNLCHPKRTGTRSGKNCFSFGIDIFCRGHRGHAVNKYPKLLSQLINSVPRTSRGQKLSTGDTGDKIALSTRVNPNKCRQLAQFKTMLSTGWPKLRFFCPRLFPAETPQKSPKVAISATTYRTLCVLAFLRLRRLAVRSRPWSWPPTAPAVRAARWFGSWPAQWR